MSYQFKPSWLTSSLFLLLIIGFTGFGIWQISSPPRTTSLQLPDFAHEALETLSLNMPFDEFAPYQRAQATGHYRATNSILLDNIMYQGRPGYHLITPFEIMASRAVILVNRGWLPKASSDGTLPAFKTPEGLITISGHLSLAQAKPDDMEQANPLSLTPPLWHYLDLNFFKQVNGYSVLPLILNLNPGGQTSTLSSTIIPADNSETALIQDWHADSRNVEWPISSASHWFLFAFISLIVYFFISFKKLKPD